MPLTGAAIVVPIRNGDLTPNELVKWGETSLVDWCLSEKPHPKLAKTQMMPNMIKYLFNIALGLIFTLMNEPYDSGFDEFLKFNLYHVVK